LSDIISFFINIMKVNSDLFITVLFLTGLSLEVSAQISPGELANAHANLEGITNCTKCHILGEKITNAKCLDCHTEINGLIKRNRGYHASHDVKGKECIACHSDHHGRNFKIINFDKDKFDHRKADYELLGKHKELECTACHRSEYIKEKISQKNGPSYLGLESDCKSCHVDYHRNTLSSECFSCHNFSAFKPASVFDHQKSKYPLLGKHLKVECEKCHKIEIQNGKKFQQFAGIQFSNCTNCHKDPHENKFGQNCRKCHNEESFHILIASNSFDHSKTNYPLTGKHLSINCIFCHKGNYTQPIKHIFCTDCHSDYHKGQFAKKGKSPDCADCHDTEGYTKTLYTIERHNTTNFKLEGKHFSAPCSSCHKKGSEWDFQQMGRMCKDCHEDYHKGEFVKAGASLSCNECHDTQAFTNVFYSIEQHNKTDFRLEGAHMATPCFSCHKKESVWQFKGVGKFCVDCHTNIHKNFIDEKYFPNQDCKYCHNTESWKEVRFDHAHTTFPLIDKHAEISCKQCHLFEKKGGTITQKFSGLSNNCLTCHKDVHFNQFDENGFTQCNKCHGFKSWREDLFNHDNTRFKLGISHVNVKCNKCHDQATSTTGTYTRYKINKLKCADCHS
jgi:predicted CXXCH cytochrome family protein